MNRFMQKTTSVILSLATVALIGAPAFAAYEPQEALNDTPAVAAEVAAEPTEGKDKIEIQESGKEEAAQAQSVETASAAAEETVEEPTEEKSETETAVPEKTANDTETEIGGSELPEISKEDVENILRSDEVINALEEAGIDGKEIINAVESGDYEVVFGNTAQTVLSDDEIEEIRIREAMMPFDDLKDYSERALGIFLLPIAPVMMLFPVFGWAVALESLSSVFVIVVLPFAFVGACIKACVIYNNFDPSQY